MFSPQPIQKLRISRPNIVIHMGASTWTAKVRAGDGKFVTGNLRKMERRSSTCSGGRFVRQACSKSREPEAGTGLKNADGFYQSIRARREG